MKRTKMLCTVTSVLIVVLLVALSVSVPIGALDEVSTSNENKIDVETLRIMSSMQDDEKLKVWIWFSDIATNDIQERTEEKCGFTREEIKKMVLNFQIV